MCVAVQESETRSAAATSLKGAKGDSTGTHAVDDVAESYLDPQSDSSQG